MITTALFTESMKEEAKEDIPLKVLAWVCKVYKEDAPLWYRNTEQYAILRNAYLKIGVYEATNYLFFLRER